MFARNLLWSFLAVFLLLHPCHIHAQGVSYGNLKSLNFANGFKDIKLGENVHALSGNLFYLDNDSKIDADSCISYACNADEILNIDSTLKLDMVGIRTYKSKIVSIYLFFDEKDAYKVLSNFLRDYGQYNEKPVEFADIYRWNTLSISLTLSYNSDLDKGVAIFSYKPLLADIKYDDNLRRQRALANLQASNVQ